MEDDVETDRTMLVRAVDVLPHSTRPVSIHQGLLPCAPSKPSVRAITPRAVDLREPGERRRSEASKERLDRRDESQAKAQPQPHSAPVATALLTKSLPSKAHACTPNDVAFKGEFNGATTVYSPEDMPAIAVSVGLRYPL
ncbi:hypothetical protein V5O48_013089 [Marasmius crinis-equi]|uniref:Uncharacterized protein n=1 Tax=Marasmius crinis-equi TaxID=585013 RepID=A0ABR3F109_9AGAR